MIVGYLFMSLGTALFVGMCFATRERRKAPPTKTDLTVMFLSVALTFFGSGIIVGIHS